MRADIHFQLRATLDAFEALAKTPAAAMPFKDLKSQAFALEAQYNLCPEVQNPVDNDTGSGVIMRITSPLKKTGAEEFTEPQARAVFAASIEHMRDYLERTVPNVYVPAEVKTAFDEPRESTLWGQPATQAPYLLNTVFGDGGQLFCMTPLEHRPSYYGILVDSTLSLDDCLAMEEVFYQAIEQECGNAEPDQEQGPDAERNPFPALDSSGYAYALSTLDPEAALKVKASVESQVALMTEAHKEQRVKSMAGEQPGKSPSP